MILLKEDITTYLNNIKAIYLWLETQMNDIACHFTGKLARSCEANHVMRHISNKTMT